MNYYSEYEQEKFNDLLYSNNKYYSEEDDDEEEDYNIYENDENNNKLENLSEENDVEEKKDNKYKKSKVYFPNNNNIEYSSSEEEEEEKEKENIYEYNNKIIKDYKLEINKKYIPLKFPRPKTKDLIYINYNKENIYLSKPGNYELIPSVITSFINVEDMNSSIKLIRPTQHVIPYNLKGYEKTINLFGFNIEPFSIDNINLEKKNNNIIKEYIPLFKIHLNFENIKIAQCLKCKGIYHQLSSFCKKIRNESLYQVFSYKCSICKNKSNIFVIDTDSKNNYDSFKKDNLYFFPKINEISGICPSIEYLIERKNKKIIKRYTMQMIIIEINNISLNEGIIEYIYQSLYQIIKENNINNKEYDNYFKYSLILYDREKIYFMHLNNKNKLINKNLEITIMNDFKDPFCPLKNDILFYDKKDFLFLLEKFQNWLIIYKQYNNNSINNSMKININTLINSINNIFNMNNNCNIYNYFHLIIFSFSYPTLNLNFLKNNSNLKFYISLFFPKNKSDKIIPFINDLFIKNIKFYYYEIDFKDNLDIKQKCEKIYFDLFSILSNDSYKNYLYDINYNISYDKSIFYNKLNKNNESIFISFLPNKKNLNIISILPQYSYPDIIQTFQFQFNIEYYTFLDNYQHIRVLSWFNHVSDKTKEIYDSYDQEVLFRISLYNYIYELLIKENNDINIINKIYIDIQNKKNTSFIEIEQIFKEKIINSIIKYRREVKMGKDINMIIIPPTLKYIILYCYCFFKQILSGYNLNLFNLLFNGPIISFIKNVYPNIISLKYIPKIKKEKFYLKPSTIYNIKKNQLLLIDNGQYINLLINDKINKEIINHYLLNFNLKENIELNEIEFNFDSYFLQNLIINKPIKIEFIKDNDILDKNILNYFIEDPFIINNNQIIKNNSIEYLSYYDYFIEINEKVYDYFYKI